MPLGKAFLAGLRHQWKLIIAIATWLAGIVAPVVVPPSFETSARPSKLAFLLVSCLTGLLFLPMTLWRRKQHMTKWLVVTIAAIIIAVGSYTAYVYLTDEWTIPYGDNRVVIGTHQSSASKASQDEGHFTRQQLIMEYAGEVERIWPETEIARHRMFLWLLYVAVFTEWSAVVMCVLQTVACASATR
jgi:hypothetical protein